MSKERIPATTKTGLYTFIRGFAAFALKTLLPVRYHGREVLDMDGPFIIIGNHQSWLDPVVMAVGTRRHQLAIMAKKELAANQLLSNAGRQLHAILVDRGNTDMEAMRSSMKALRGGEVMGIFPEGTRYHAGLMEELETGAAMLTLRSGAPLVPMYIPEKLKLFRRTECYVGEPIDYADLKAQGINSETCKALLERITAWYTAKKNEVDAN